MNYIPYIAVLVFLLGYLLISLEHKFNIHKSAISLLTGGALWVLTALYLGNKEKLTHFISEAGSEIFSIVVFLLAAMTLVEILVHYKLFDLIRVKLLSLGLNDKKQFIVIGILTFFLSAILDNLTVTIVMIQIARRFFKNENLLIVGAGIVILANAGGAWSPIGDVTTIMLWLAGKFTAMEIISRGFLPALALGVVATGLLVRQMKDTSFDIAEETVRFTRGEGIVIVCAMLSFILPLVMNSFGLPPYMGLLIGLGLVWFLIEFIKQRSGLPTHLDANIEHLLQKTDISSLKFFIGILLAVSALHAMGLLEILSHVVFGEHPTFTTLVTGNVVLGLLSAIVDNVPLTALAIDVMKVTNPSLWVFTALMVGTGGSALIIGSVSGVVAMGMLKELNFGKYLKIATVPALVGYAACVVVWLVQYRFIG